MASGGGRESTLSKQYRCENCGVCPDISEVNQILNTDSCYVSDVLLNMADPGPLAYGKTLTPQVIVVPVECWNCKESIGFTVEVDATVVWGGGRGDPRIDDYSVNHAQVVSDDEQVTSLLDPGAFYGDYEIESQETEFDIDESVLAYKEDVLDLAIIAKTRMMRGHCYMTWDEQGNLLRPIYKTAPGTCCWSSSADMQIGQTYRFTILRHPTAPTKPPTPLPHRNEDTVVEQGPTFIGNFDTQDLYDRLCVHRGVRKRISDIFGQLNERKYVHENTDCPSVGILRCQDRDVCVKEVEEWGKKKTKLSLTLLGEGDYEFTMTGLQFGSLVGGDHDVFVLLGLARPFDGKGKFKPKRCYVLGLNIFTGRV